jgi:hypothetical protein
MDAVFVGKSGQVNLTIPNPGKEGKSYREMYFVIGVLHPTGSSSNVGGATDHP